MSEWGNDGRARRSGGPGRHRAGDMVDERADALLAAAIRDGGDPGAVEKLRSRHAPAALVYAGICCRDTQTAQDLAGEAFDRAVQAARTGRGGPVDAWRPWLLTAVRDTAADWAGQARRVDLAPAFGAWLDAGARREKAAAAGPRGTRPEGHGPAAAAFHSLPERWRAALWHTFVEQEPATTAGTLLGLTPGGAASLTDRAREGLKEAYLAAGPDPAGDEAAALDRDPGPVLAAAVLRFGDHAYLEARATTRPVADREGPATGWLGLVRRLRG
ncbi:RNA polymerase sigma factor [Streptomyces nitrosporeus]|uniref:RNA polymerase sigma factor n=1 Tax=Streptomyces nitrosporeus TaxID=28894 RepID=UPI00332A3DCD